MESYKHAKLLCMPKGGFMGENQPRLYKRKESLNVNTGGTIKLALCVGASRLPPTCKHVFHFDDDTIMPPGMVFDERHFDDPTTAAVSYDISCFQDGVCERLVDFELRLWSHWRLYRATYAGTAWFCHGIVGLWKREKLEAALSQHPLLPFGEDGWLGQIVMSNGDRIAQELRSAVTTFAPPRLVPPVSLGPLDCGRTQGYGAASVWKQRSTRWFVNAPRRIPHLLGLFFGYRARDGLAADMLFRVELVRHLFITVAIVFYPFFLARVAYDDTWLYLLELKADLSPDLATLRL